MSTGIGEKKLNDCYVSPTNDMQCGVGEKIA